MSVEKIAFENIVKKLDAQRADINNLRNQASVSAAVTGLIGAVFASIVGPAALADGVRGDFILGFSLPAVFLFLVFAASIAFAVLVVVELHDFTFSFDSNIMMSERDKHSSDERFFAAYVRDGEWFFADNEAKISFAQGRLWWAMVLGWAQIIPWIVLTAGFSDGQR